MSGNFSLVIPAFSLQSISVQTNCCFGFSNRSSHYINEYSKQSLPLLYEIIKEPVLFVPLLCKYWRTIFFPQELFPAVRYISCAEHRHKRMSLPSGL